MWRGKEDWEIIGVQKYGEKDMQERSLGCRNEAKEENMKKNAEERRIRSTLGIWKTNKKEKYRRGESEERRKIKIQS